MERTLVANLVLSRIKEYSNGMSAIDPDGFSDHCKHLLVDTAAKKLLSELDLVDFVDLVRELHEKDYLKLTPETSSVINAMFLMTREGIILRDEHENEIDVLTGTLMAHLNQRSE